MATAAIKFTQGVNVGTPGVAMFGVTGQSVLVENGVAAVNYKFEVIDVPPGSAVPIGTVQDGSTPSWSFLPDVPGGYQIQITVKDSSGLTAIDQRSFGVKEASGRYIPAFKARGLANNFLNQLRGWAPYLEKWLRFIDGIAPLVVATTGNIDNLSTKASGEAVYALRLTGASPVLRGLQDGYPGRRLFIYPVNNTTLSNLNGGSSAGNQIATGTGGDVVLAAGSCAEVVYDNAAWHLVLGAQSGLVAELPPIANSDTGVLEDIVSTSGPANVSGVRFTNINVELASIASPAAGRRFTVFADGGDVVLKHLAGSTIDNSIIISTGADLTLPHHGAVLLEYNGTIQRWHILSLVASGGVTVPGNDGEFLYSDGAGAMEALDNSTALVGQVVGYVDDGGGNPIPGIITPLAKPVGNAGDAVIIGAGPGFDLATTTHLNVDSTNINVDLPIRAKSGAAYSVHGDASQAIVDNGTPQNVSAANLAADTLVLTGALTASRTLGGFTHPAVGAGYKKTFDNQTTGAQDVVIGTGTGTTATIPNGTIRDVIFDSTGARLKSIGGGSFSAGGDLSGSSSSQNVIKANGATIPIAGSLVTGNVLQVSGVSALGYGPVNLVGGANYVSGRLPLNNINLGANGQFLGSNGSSNAWGNSATHYTTQGTVPAAGLFRILYAATDVIIAAKDSTAADRKIISRNGAEQLQFSDSGYNTTIDATTLTVIGRGGGLQLYSGPSATYSATLNGVSFRLALDIAGLNNPLKYQRATVSIGNSSLTATPTQYESPFWTLSGFQSASTELLLPNTTGGTINIKYTGTGNPPVRKVTTPGSGGFSLNVGSQFAHHNGSDWEGR